MNNTIQIEGAKVHNLRNLDLEIPREKLVVITNNSAQEYQLLVSGSDQSYTVDLDGQLFTFETDWCIGEPLLRANINGREVVSQVDQIGQHIHLFHQGSKKDELGMSLKKIFNNNYFKN